MILADRSRVYDFYGRGFTVTETVKRTRIEYDYVNHLYYEWEVEKAKKKRADDALRAAEHERSATLPKIPAFYSKVSSFVLLTNRLKVSSAWKTLKDGWVL